MQKVFSTVPDDKGRAEKWMLFLINQATDFIRSKQPEHFPSKATHNDHSRNKGALLWVPAVASLSHSSVIPASRGH